MAIKMIVSDLDDTLLNSASALTERTVNALQRAMDRGVYVVLASGRMPRAMLNYAEQISVNAPIIAYNGAVTLDLADGHALSRFSVPKDAAIAVCERAAMENLYIQAFINGAYYFEEENEYNRRYGQSIGLIGTAVHQPLARFIDRDCEKLLLIGDAERMTRAAIGFSDQFGGRLNCFISRPTYIECTGIEATKGNAVRALAETLSVKPEEIVAFGDAQNDLSMLFYAGRGYAVANARPEVLDAVKYRAPSNDKDGVAQTIEELLLSGEENGI